MRCLVTGATGFIGSHLTQLLLNKGCEVAFLLRPADDLWRIQEYLPSLQVFEADLLEVKNVSAQIRNFQPQIVVHAGWYGVDKDQRNHFDQINYNLYGSLNLLSECLESGCQYFIGLGSQAEYGQTDKTLEEEMPAQPSTMYGVVKLCTGLLAQRMCASAGVPFSWLRLTAAYGPKDQPNNLIPYVISSLLQQKEPALTHGNQKWDYLYIDDLINAIWSLIEHPAAQGIFNLSSGRAVPVRHICEIIRGRIDPRLPLGFGKVLSPAGERMCLEARNDRLRLATGWEPKISLDNGIEKTIAWHLSRSHS